MGVGNDIFLQLRRTDGAANAEKGVECAIGVWSDKYQTLAGRALAPVGRVRNDAGGFEVPLVKVAPGIAADQAGVIGLPAEPGDADHGIGG